MELTFSRDKSMLDLPMIHAFLTASYWAKGRTMEEVQRSIENSHCFGGFYGEKQVAFARVITDKVSFAYLLDVFVLPDQQKKGIGLKMMNFILAEEDFQMVRSWFLGTKDAHDLYRKVGFEALKEPEKWMKKMKLP